MSRRFVAFAAALLAGASLAHAKDSVTIGMTLEPPGLDPTAGAASAIGEITHYNIFEGLTKINEDFSVTPLLADSWTFSPDLKTLTLTLKKGVKFQDGEPFTSKDVKFSFERFAAKESTNKDKAFFASIQSIDASDPAKVTLTFSGPSFAALLHLGYNTAVILDEKSAANEATQPVGTGPYKLANWSKGSSATLDAWDGYRDAGKIAIKHATFKFISDSAAETAAVLSGDIDVFPRIVASAVDQFKGDPRYQAVVGGTEGKTILGINNKKPPLDQLKVRQAIAYALDRQGDHRRRLERYGNADRQPSDAERSRLCRPDRPVSARSRESQGAARRGRRQDAVEPDVDAAAARLTRAKAARSSPPSSPRSAFRQRSRTSNGRSGSPTSTPTRTTI